jgi:hypothetical protein
VQTLKYNFRIIRSNVPEECAIYEELRTKVLNDSESITLIKEETTFTKDGEYIIAIHWSEDMGSASADDKKLVKELLYDKM